MNYVILLSLYCVEDIVMGVVLLEGNEVVIYHICFAVGLYYIILSFEMLLSYFHANSDETWSKVFKV